MEVEASSRSSGAGEGDGPQDSGAAALATGGGGHEQQQQQQQQQQDGRIPHASNATTCSTSTSVEALLSVPLSLIMRELPTPAAGDVPVGPRQRRGGLGGVGDVSSNGGAGGGTAAPADAPTIRPPPPPPPRRRTLLSRSEASVLLRVSQLAIEHDALVELASAALQNANMCASYRERIERSCRGGGSGIGTSPQSPQQQQQQQPPPPAPPLQYPTRYLLPLLPILSVHADTVQRRTIRHVSNECNRVLMELTKCCGSLRQFADQNWTVSEHLYMDGRGGVGGVGRDKGSLAEIEEAICDRIDGLVGMAAVTGSGVDGNYDDPDGPTCSSGDANGGAHYEDNNDANGDDKKITKKRKRGKDERGSPQDVFDASVDFTTGQFVSMAELCRRLFTDLGDQVEESEGSAEIAEHSQDVSVDRPSVDEAPASSLEASSTGTKPTSAGDGGSSEKGEGKDVEMIPRADMNEARGGASGDSDEGGGEQPSRTMGACPSAGSNDSASSGGSTNSDENDRDDEEPGDELVEMDEDCHDDDEPRGSSASSSSPERGQLTQSAAATLAVLASGSQTY